MIETVDLGGLAATVGETGMGGASPTVVFLHGIGSSRHSFDEQLDYFAQRFHCICPDAPGYGDSLDPPKPLEDMDDFAAIYETALKDYGPLVLVGVSFGGVLAARIAIRKQVDVSAMVLADSSRGSGTDPRRASAMRERATTLQNEGNEAFAAGRAKRLLSASAEPDLIAAVAANMARSIRLPGYGYAASAMAATDHTSRLAEIRCPTLVLVGECDRICPPSESQILAAAIPGARYVELPKAGHLSNQEAPDQFNQVVENFLTTYQTPISLNQQELNHVKI